MKNSYILLLGIFLVSGIVIIARDSYANSVIEENKELDLELSVFDDLELFKNELYDYIDLIDNSLIPNATYDMFSKLNENYDFLTRFSVSLILDNRECYDIVLMDEYKYIDQYGSEFNTKEYINVDKIYDITNKIFGIDYYYILNDYIEINNDMVPLLELDSREFKGEIEDITFINKSDKYMEVFVKYKDNEIDYVYKFDFFDNRYVISDLVIRE